MYTSKGRDRMYDVYLAAPLWTAKQKERIASLAEVLRQEGYSVFVPMEHEIDNAWDMPQHEWSKKVFDADIKAIHNSAAVVAIYNGLYSDSGTAFEMGYAHALGKDIYVVPYLETKEVSLMIKNAVKNPGLFDEVGVIER